jgi:hypothetical protein
MVVATPFPSSEGRFKTEDPKWKQLENEMSQHLFLLVKVVLHGRDLYETWGLSRNTFSF